MITASEIRAIRIALGFALSGENDDWNIRQHDRMKSALNKLREKPQPAALVPLTRAEAGAVIGAIGQMTDGNARDFGEWRKQTSGTRTQWLALLRAELRIGRVSAGRGR